MEKEPLSFQDYASGDENFEPDPVGSELPVTPKVAAYVILEIIKRKKNANEDYREKAGRLQLGLLNGMNDEDLNSIKNITFPPVKKTSAESGVLVEFSPREPKPTA